MKEAVLATLVASVPAWPYLAFMLDFRRTIERKRADVKRLIHSDTARSKYRRQFAIEDDTPRALALFNENYHVTSYIFPAVATFVVTVSWVLLCFATLQMVSVPEWASPVVRSFPHAGMAAVAGSHAAALTQMYRLRRLDDLSPRRLHAIWMHLMIAPFIGALAQAALKAPVDVFVGFGLAVLPLRTLIDWVSTSARKAVGIGSDSTPSEDPNLFHLQGMSSEVVIRLAEEGITSANHMAYADPVKIMLVSGLERKVLLDLMDQALLYMYLEGGAAKIRSVGIRGAIELCETFNQSRGSNATARDRAEKALAVAAAQLSQSVDGLNNLAYTLLHDAQVELLWQLWGTSFETAAAAEEPMEAPGLVKEGA